MLQTINPNNGQVIREYPTLTDAECSAHIQRAVAAFPQWRDTSFQERATCLRAIAAALRLQKDKLAQLMATEMGKPLKEGGPEVEKAAWCCEHYADHGEAYLAREILPSDASLSYVSYEPLGTLLGILPWNAPLWLAFRYLAPALMAGNTCVLKHDPGVPGCAAAIADAVAQACNQTDMPADIMVNLPLENQQVEAVIRDPRIAGVSFTGSSKTGRLIAGLAGAELKHAVLELGGSDPCIVMADADLQAATDIATLSRIINAGQSCIAAKRIIVENAVYEEFIQLLKVRLERLQLGDPLQPETDIGPLARDDLRQNLHRQVTETIAAGAQCLLGGTLPAGPGFFYPVTLLTDVMPGMCAFREETFGPVMAVTPAADFEHALALANDTTYGLGASIWTTNKAHAEAAAIRLNAGQVAINGIVKTDPRLPSGGIKGSGLGRELGPHGIKEFVNAKQVWIK